MTVHLACSSRGETSAKSVTGSLQRNSHARCCSGMVLWSCSTLPCPWLPTSDAEGPSYGRRSTSCWKVPVCWREPAHATWPPGRYSLTPKFVAAHSSRYRPHKYLSLHNLIIHQILGWKLWKSF